MNINIKLFRFIILLLKVIISLIYKVLKYKAVIYFNFSNKLISFYKYLFIYKLYNFNFLIKLYYLL